MSSEECRDNCRRSLACTQAVLVRCTHNRRLQQTVVTMHRCNNIHKEGHKLQILKCCTTRLEEINTRICSKRPVIMLTRSIDTLEWFFMQKHAEVMTCSNLTHNGHKQLVMVVCKVCLLIYWSQLILIWCNLIMTCFQWNTKLQTLVLQILHKGQHSLWNSTKIVIVELLILCRLVSHKRTACLHEVRACRPECIINQEVLLLPAEEYLHSLNTSIKVATHLCRSTRYSRNGAQERSLIVESLARVRYKYSRNTKCCIYDKCRRCRVPCRVTSRLEGITDTTTRERRSIGFLLHKHLTRELLQHTTRAIRLGE